METKLQIGEMIYLPTSLSLTMGKNDFLGGCCSIKKIEGTNIEFVENPGKEYNWKQLEKLQEELAWKYGNRRGKQIPDYNPTHNGGN